MHLRWQLVSRLEKEYAPDPLSPRDRNTPAPDDFAAEVSALVGQFVPKPQNQDKANLKHSDAERDEPELELEEEHRKLNPRDGGEEIDRVMNMYLRPKHSKLGSLASAPQKTVSKHANPASSHKAGTFKVLSHACRG